MHFVRRFGSMMIPHAIFADLFQHRTLTPSHIIPHFMQFHIPQAPTTHTTLTKTQSVKMCIYSFQCWRGWVSLPPITLKIEMHFCRTLTHTHTHDKLLLHTIFECQVWSEDEENAIDNYKCKLIPFFREGGKGISEEIVFLLLFLSLARTTKIWNYEQKFKLEIVFEVFSNCS